MPAECLLYPPIDSFIARSCERCKFSREGRIFWNEVFFRIFLSLAKEEPRVIVLCRLYGSYTSQVGAHSVKCIQCGPQFCPHPSSPGRMRAAVSIFAQTSVTCFNTG